MENDTAHWLNTHSHISNSTVPSGDGSMIFTAGTVDRFISPSFLQALKFTEADACYIMSTGHGRSGPFRFGGVLVLDFLEALMPHGAKVNYVDFESADAYGTRLNAGLLNRHPRPLLAYTIDGSPMTRAQGLVRLIVPGELEDALHQVKWLSRIAAMLTKSD